MFLHHVAHDFDATRHFLAGQVHPGNWFGNIVAGVVVFIVVDVCWQAFLKKWVARGLARIHRAELERHHAEVVKPLLEAQHKEVLNQAKQHLDEQMLKLTEALAPAKKVAVKKTTKGKIE
jgi:hypothetical protein